MGVLAGEQRYSCACAIHPLEQLLKVFAPPLLRDIVSACDVHAYRISPTATVSARPCLAKTRVDLTSDVVIASMGEPVEIRLYLRRL